MANNPRTSPAAPANFAASFQPLFLAMVVRRYVYRISRALILVTSTIMCFFLWSCAAADPDAVLSSEGVGTALDEVLHEMARGVAVFNYSRTMNIADTKDVAVVISLSDRLEQLKRDLHTVGYEAVGANIDVSNRMEVVLSSPGMLSRGFHITPLGSATQAVSAATRTEWRWAITPRRSGTSRVVVVITALLDVDGHETPRTVTTLTGDIAVDATLRQAIWTFWLANWGWLIGMVAIIGPIIGWCVGRKSSGSATSSGGPPLAAPGAGVAVQNNLGGNQVFKAEIHYIDIGSAARIVALVLGIFGVFTGPVALAALLFMGSDPVDAVQSAFFIALVYTIVLAAVGCVVAAIGVLIYNQAARRMGGIQLRLRVE